MNSIFDLTAALSRAISALMTDAQLDAPVVSNGGQTTRQLIAKTTIGFTGLLECRPTKDSAKIGRIKAYWHPHGYLSPTKLNAEWYPLVLDIPEELCTSN